MTDPTRAEGFEVECSHSWRTCPVHSTGTDENARTPNATTVARLAARGEASIRVSFGSGSAGKVGTLSLPERLHQLVLGAIINFWQQQTTLQSIGGVTSAESLTAQPDLLAETVKEALETHLLPSESLSAEDRKAIRELLGMADEATGERAGGDDGNGG